MTLAEKIFARHMTVDAASGKTGVSAVRAAGDAGFAVVDIRFRHEYVTPMAAAFFEREMGPEGRVADPGSVYFFRDHLTFLDEVMTPEKRKEGLLDLARSLKDKQEEFAARQGIRLHGELKAGPGVSRGSEAICHSKILQDYALPGQLIAGTDSHTPHSGAIGAVAFGVGTTDMFNAWVTKDVRVKIPGSVLIRVNGKRAGQRDGQGHHAGHPQPPVRQRRLRHREADRVRRPRGGGAHGGRARHHDQHGGGGRRVHRTSSGPTCRPRASWRSSEGWRVRRRNASARDGRAIPTPSGSMSSTLDGERLQPMVATPGDPGNGTTVEELRRELRRPGQGRDRLRRILHGGQARGHGHVRRASCGRGSRGVARSIPTSPSGSSSARRRSRSTARRQGYLELFAARRGR